MPPPADWQLGRYRALLHLHARQVQRDPRLGRRFDASDVVQEALLRGHANLGQFRGSTEAELVGWRKSFCPTSRPWTPVSSRILKKSWPNIPIWPRI
jgi:hypothetical protein